MRQVGWRAASLLVGVLIVLLAAGCGKDSGDGTVKLRIGEVTRSLFYAPQYAALSQGFFEEEGLEIDLQPTYGGDKTMTALLSGSIDIGLVGSETSIYVYQQGADDPVINFAQMTQTDGTFLVAREPEVDFQWEDLKGAVFLGQRKGGMPQMAGEFALKKHGIDPAADLQLIQNVDFANIPAAFASGTGEYVQLFEPQASIFEQEGTGYVVASFGVESGNLPYTVYMARESFIAENKEAFQKFTRALYRAQQWVESQPADVVADAVLPYFEDADKEIVTRVIERYKEQHSYAVDPVIDEAEWNNLLDIMESAGELNSMTPHAAIVDNSFAELAKRP
ncbi:ABC transporter substrate-binding protein [Paenibacillus tarimensis]|uniref:ABC transporter substrate-binding protein n=1 Tax=Paenibacillus tarimensis TaxID=416012 RepID=UPI001F164C60|nr:ABC transporter substrate-binding protein [Paenibacillus tarimensis]MCF2942645.1 ABC transporter substrate-binding protein [Paenibacillus tarimensis]